jgi:RNA polymerase sigma factor (TIGR02999 family)
MSATSAQVRFNQLVDQLRQGQHDAANALFPMVYDELRRIAARLLRAGAPQTLQSTALVNEAYIRLAGRDLSVENRNHFIALSARAMRMVLVDAIRNRGRAKRGGNPLEVTFESGIVPVQSSRGILQLHDALAALQNLDERQAQIVELHYFGGLALPEIADAMNISLSTVNRELRMAKAFLAREMSHA